MSDNRRHFSIVYSIAIFELLRALTQTLTQTAKKAGGNNGVERAKKDMFWNRKGRKGAESTTKRNQRTFTRMRSLVRVQ